jgi:predicted AlkP superfamily pyrophosphatase or phosphodiesterase
VRVWAKTAALGCVALACAASLAAQQRGGRYTWSERPPSPQTAHSRTFTQRAAAQQAPIQHVILVSVDGMMPDTYVHPDAHGLKIPTLRAIVRQGSSSEGVFGVFPTVTYPSHTSMVTGVNPGTHGIITNAAWDPLGNLHGAWRWYAEDIRVPTLWDAARAKGLTTALVFWPVTVGAKASAVVPEFWRQVPGSVEDAKLNFAISTPGLLDVVAKHFPNFRAKFVPPRAEDEALTDVAVHVIEALKPNLLLLHIADVDHLEHEDGPFTGRVLPALETADEQIARVIGAAKKAGIWNQTALVVVSDHGFARTAQRVRPGVWLREKGFVKVEDRTIVEWRAYCLASSGSAYVYVKDPDDRETRKALLEMFQQAAAKADSGIRRVLTHEQIVRVGGDPDAFLALEAAEGWAITGGVVGDAISPAIEAAEHGYPPERPEMRSSLLVYGPAIGHSKIENARMIDIAPTIARWLGLKLEKTEGTPLKIPLRRVPAPL